MLQTNFQVHQHIKVIPVDRRHIAYISYVRWPAPFFYAPPHKVNNYTKRFNAGNNRGIYWVRLHLA